MGFLSLFVGDVRRKVGEEDGKERERERERERDTHTHKGQRLHLVVDLWACPSPGMVKRFIRRSSHPNM